MHAREADRDHQLPPVGIIGVGSIASAIVDGLCGACPRPPKILLSPRGATTAAELAARHESVQVCTDNQSVAGGANLLLLTVRPESLHSALRGVQLPARSVVVSALAGVSHAALQQALGKDVTIIRAIPLPSVRRQQGLTAVFPADHRAKALFDRLGGTLEVSDAHAFDALSAATGTISTLLAYLTTIADWVSQHGIEPALADRYVRHIALGLSGPLADPRQPLSRVAADHETPGGQNERLRRAWYSEEAAEALKAALDDLHARLDPAGNRSSAARPPDS